MDLDAEDSSLGVAHNIHKVERYKGGNHVDFGIRVYSEGNIKIDSMIDVKCDVSFSPSIYHRRCLCRINSDNKCNNTKNFTFATLPPPNCVFYKPIEKK